MAGIQMPRRRLAAAATLIACAGALAGAPGAGQAAGTVTRYAFSPSPIGKQLAPSTLVHVTVTADSGSSPVAGAVIYLSFTQAVGGGTAYVGQTALRAKPASFTASGTGQVTIDYTSPPVKPSTGADTIRAENAATAATSTIKATDTYSYSNIGSISMVPQPIARAGTLGGNQSVPVTVTVFDSGGGRATNATIYLSAVMVSGGGSATVNGVALTASPAPFKTDGNGNITVTFRTASSVPHSGSDKIVAADQPGSTPIKSSDGYTFK